MEWARDEQGDDSSKLDMAKIRIFARNRTGLLVDITKILTERKIDVQSISSRMSKQGMATISYEFQVQSRDELRELIEKIRQVDNVIDVQRTSG